MISHLIVGLGNPGKQYDNTPHNLGFAALDQLQEKLGAPNFSSNNKFNALESQIGNFLLIKPQTYMNLSGKCLAKYAQFYKIRPDHILIAHDEFSIPLGELKISQGKGPANHNGVASIIDALHNTDMPRFRLGIGKDLTIPLETYVLSPLDPRDQSTIDGLLAKTTNAITTVIDKGISLAMTTFN